MIRVGLKLWSTNIEYIPLLEALRRKGSFEYIELFVVPGSLDVLAQWAEIKGPYVLHAPHSYAGLNMALPQEAENRRLLEEVSRYSRALSPEAIIFHSGTVGDWQEAVRQFLFFRNDFLEVFDQALLENKPQLGLKGEHCVGASPLEIKNILSATGMGFCLDFGHAVSYAASVKADWREVISDFLLMQPALFHVCDGQYSIKDGHLHLGDGEFDLPWIISQIPPGSRVTLETPKNSKEDLSDFVRDVGVLRGLSR